MRPTNPKILNAKLNFHFLRAYDFITHGRKGWEESINNKMPVQTNERPDLLKSLSCAFYINVYDPVIYQALQNQAVDTLQLTIFSYSLRGTIKNRVLKKLSLQKAVGISFLKVSLKYHFQMQGWLTCWNF